MCFSLCLMWGVFMAPPSRPLMSRRHDPSAGRYLLLRLQLVGGAGAQQLVMMMLDEAERGSRVVALSRFTPTPCPVPVGSRVPPVNKRE